MTTITARERLINAAVEAFAEKGFAGTTTRDIASRAGMSPAAVYVHHDSKESLLFSVSLDGHRRALEVITSAAASSTDPVDRLRAMVYDFSLWHADNSRPRRRRMGHQRLQDVHHERILRRSRDHCRPHLAGQGSEGHQPVRDRGDRSRLQPRAQARQGWSERS